MSYKWLAVALVIVLLGARLACALFGSTSPPAREKAVPRLSDRASAHLAEAGWHQRVGGELGLWVSVAEQRLRGIQDGQVRFEYPCSTAARGTGNREGSNQTPLGWHEVSDRIGDGLPQGAIFVERRHTGKTWTASQPTTKDFVLTRILWLRGLEPGLNAGPGIDSHDRFIYIHGTPAEEKLGTPASMGCIRLSNAAMISVFDQTPPGTRVLITEW